MKTISQIIILVLLAVGPALRAQNLGDSPAGSAPTASHHALAPAPADGDNTGAGASEDEEKAELAKKLQNPVANPISVPIQNNWDFGIGPANAMR